MILQHIFALPGGQFAPNSGGQLTPNWGGQFHAEQVVSLNRIEVVSFTEFSNPGALYLEQVLDRFVSASIIVDRWTAGQEIFADVAHEQQSSVKILGAENFYPILPEQWNLAWSDDLGIVNVKYGLHIYTSKIRRRKNDDLGIADQILGAQDRMALLKAFPNSLFKNLLECKEIFT